MAICETERERGSGKQNLGTPWPCTSGFQTERKLISVFKPSHVWLLAMPSSVNQNSQFVGNVLGKDYLQASASYTLQNG